MKIKHFIKQNSAGILTWIAAVGVISTAIAAARATPKAILLLKAAQNEKEEPLTTIESVRTVAPAYIPTAFVGTATICCIFGIDILGKRRQAQLTSAYAMLSNRYQKYREASKTVYGEDAEDRISSEMARNCHNYHQIKLDCPDQKVIFYDEISGESISRYEREIMDAEYHFNRNFVMRGYATLNEFYEFLGLPPISDGDQRGWSMASGICWIDFEHRLLSKDDGGMDIYAIDAVYSPEDLEPWECI